MQRLISQISESNRTLVFGPTPPTQAVVRCALPAIVLEHDSTVRGGRRIVTGLVPWINGLCTTSRKDSSTMFWAQNISPICTSRDDLAVHLSKATDCWEQVVTAHLDCGLTVDFPEYRTEACNAINFVLARVFNNEEHAVLLTRPRLSTSTVQILLAAGLERGPQASRWVLNALRWEPLGMLNGMALVPDCRYEHLRAALLAGESLPRATTRLFDFPNAVRRRFLHRPYSRLSEIRWPRLFEYASSLLAAAQAAGILLAGDQLNPFASKVLPELYRRALQKADAVRVMRELVRFTQDGAVLRHGYEDVLRNILMTLDYLATNAQGVSEGAQPLQSERVRAALVDAKELPCTTEERLRRNKFSKALLEKAMALQSQAPEIEGVKFVVPFTVAEIRKIGEDLDVCVKNLRDAQQFAGDDAPVLVALVREGRAVCLAAVEGRYGRRKVLYFRAKKNSVPRVADQAVMEQWLVALNQRAL